MEHRLAEVGRRNEDAAIPRFELLFGQDGSPMFGRNRLFHLRVVALQKKLSPI